MMDPLENPILGETIKVIELSTNEDNRQVAIAMARQCRRHLEITSRHLLPINYLSIYTMSQCLEELKSNAR
jgi:hypothetical protein